MNANARSLAGRPGGTRRHWFDDETSIPRVAGHNNSQNDAGARGIIAEVARLTESQAFYQLEALLAASPEIQSLARVRIVALRSRLLDRDEVAA